MPTQRPHTPHHLLLIILPLLLHLSACTHTHRQYTAWHPLPPAGWAYGDTLHLNPLDTTLHGNDTTLTRPLSLTIAHTNGYPYANLWLEITYRGPHTAYRDTLNLRLADNYGRWLGQGIGTTYQHTYTITPAANLDLRHPIDIRHIMRLDTLRGLDAIGIHIN